MHYPQEGFIDPERLNNPAQPKGGDTRLLREGMMKYIRKGPEHMKFKKGFKYRLCNPAHVHLIQ